MSISANQTPPFTPESRAASMRFVQTLRSTHAHWAGMSAPCLARSPGTGGVNLCSGCLSIAHHLPASLRSTGIAPLQRYYGCSDSCAAAFRNSLNLDSRSDRTGLPSSRTTPSNHSVSSHLTALRCRFVTPHSDKPVYPGATCNCQRSGLLQGFAHCQQSRRAASAESSSLSYGLVVRLLLLSTPHRCDAVTQASEG